MLYKHLKSGQIYDTIDENAKLEWDPWQAVVVYTSIETGKMWVRRRDEFFDGRFEKVKTVAAFYEKIRELEKERKDTFAALDEFRENCNHYYSPTPDIYNPPICLICGSVG